MLMMSLAGVSLARISGAGALAMWQAADGLSGRHTVILEIFVGLVAFALLVQAVAVVVVAVGAAKAQKSVMIEVAEIKSKLMPLIEKSHGLVTDLTPTVKNIAANVEHISLVVREKVMEFEPTVSAANVTIRETNQTVRDANAKAHAQIVRVNGMITSALTATAEIGEKIHQGIRVPVREIEGIVSGARAAIFSLMSKARGFGGGIRTEPARPGSGRTGQSVAPVDFASGLGARPAASVVRPPHSAGINVAGTSEVVAEIVSGETVTPAAEAETTRR